MGRHLDPPTRALIAAVVAALLLLTASPVGAFERDERDVARRPDAPVSAEGDRVTVYLETVGGATQARIPAGVRQPGGAAERECELSAVIMPALDELWLVHEGDFPDDGAVPIRIMCGGAIVDQRWITPAETRDYDTIARTEAQRHIEHHLAPTMAIAHSPPTNALVGLPTWTWLTGWDATPITIGPITPFDRTLTIELTLHHTTWDFGDPHTPNPVTIVSLGTPHTPDIAHTYTHHGPHTITATTAINVTYTLDTTTPHTVDPLTTTHTTPITLHQLQAVLTHG